MAGSKKNPPISPLTEEDLIRYDRQILFPAFGEEGQRKLKQSHVLIAGLGGLGSPVAIYLACAGVGKLTVIDSDAVELSNLNRQILHWDADIGEQKVIFSSSKAREAESDSRDNSPCGEDNSRELFGVLAGGRPCHGLYG